MGRDLERVVVLTAKLVEERHADRNVYCGKTTEHQDRWNKLCENDGAIGARPRRRALEAFRRKLPGEYKAD